MKYLSVCSGIEAASAAWHSLGWQPVGFSEIEPFPCSVLEHRFPDVTNFGDMTKFEEWPIEPGSIDVLVGGTPCQSFSIAGLRGGLKDGRGNLALTYCRIVQKLQPKWFVWENVPGVLSSNSGRDFGSIVGAMAELGYGLAYRVLDAQYFGVPQRRRRVFIVGCAGDWRRAAAVLFESGCVSGDSSKGGKAKQNVAALTANGVGTCGADDNQGQAGHLIPTTQFGPIAGTLTRRHDSSPCHDRGQNIVATPFAQNQLGEVRVGEVFNTINTNSNASGRNTPMVHIATSTGETAHCLNAGGMGRQDYETETMVVAIQERAVSTNIENGPQGAGFRDDGKAYTLEARNKVQAVAFTQNQRNEVRELDVIGALQANPGMKQQAYLSQPVGVRRLTPRECERLQGFPDDWTLVSHRGKPAADGPRYKAIGNSMAVPVMRWIGKRIELVKE
jgi:DNA (cytosine-5)-methyltransferase 1